VSRRPDLYAGFPPWFFARLDESPDARFYEPVRRVTHIDDQAIAAVGRLYTELGLDADASPPARVLDLMASWVSHFRRPPGELTVLGMNRTELDANPAATARVVHDLNADPRLPFDDQTFTAVVCCASVDYLVRPVEVVTECARVLVAGGVVCFTFSNRCFPTKAIAGWLHLDDDGRAGLVAEYIRRAGGFGPATTELRTALGAPGDPLWAVWARRAS
jgi:SAM-dependent methyltransferase